VTCIENTRDGGVNEASVERFGLHQRLKHHGVVDDYGDILASGSVGLQYLGFALYRALSENMV